MADLDVIEREDGSWVTSDGELVEIPAGDDALFWAAQRHREADAQVRAWTRDKTIFAQMLIKRQQERSAAYGDTLAVVNYRALTTFDAVAFALALEEQNGEGFRPVPGVTADVVAYCALSMASGFHKGPLHADLLARFQLSDAEADAVVAEIGRRAAELTTVTGQSRPWVETRTVKRRKEIAA